MSPGPVKIPELLAPAGDPDKLRTAVLYGADAVYLGARRYSLRARAGNFDPDELREALTFAHERGVKVYVTVNIYARGEDLRGLPELLAFLEEAGADAAIVSDPGVIRLARRHAPGLPLHLSTQANVTNAEHARFWAEQGIARLNLARELNMAEVREIRAAVGCGLEVFVHGALCIAYSGRCLLSGYLTGREANRGDCAQPCRYAYALVEEKRPGQYFPIEEDGRGSYVFNARDLCLLAHLPKLVALGVDALKIEGRMKAVAYVAQTVHLYRHALDWIAAQVAEGADAAHLTLPEAFFAESAHIGTRGHTDNGFAADGFADALQRESPRLGQSSLPAAIVRQTDPLVIETRHALEPGEPLECLLPNRFAPLSCRVTALEDAEGRIISRAHPNRRLRLYTEPRLCGIPIGALLRKPAAATRACA